MAQIGGFRLWRPNDRTDWDDFWSHGHAYNIHVVLKFGRDRPKGSGKKPQNISPNRQITQGQSAYQSERVGVAWWRQNVMIPHLPAKGLFFGNKTAEINAKNFYKFIT